MTRTHESPGSPTGAPMSSAPVDPIQSSTNVEIVPPVHVVWDYNVRDFRRGGSGVHPRGANVRIRLPRRRLTAAEMEAAATLAYRAGHVVVECSNSDGPDLKQAIARKRAELDRAEREAASLTDARLEEWRRIRDYCRAQGDTYRAGWWNERIARAEGDLYVAEEPGPMLRSVGGTA